MFAFQILYFVFRGLERIPSCESLILKNGQKDPTLTDARHLRLGLTKSNKNRIGKPLKRGDFKKRQFDSNNGTVEVKGVDNAFEKKHFEAKKEEDVESSRVERRRKIKRRGGDDLNEDGAIMDRKLGMVNREGQVGEEGEKKNESFGVGVYFTRGYVDDDDNGGRKAKKGDEVGAV